MKQETLFQVGKAAEILGVSPETLRRWDRTGKFESIRHPMNNYRVYSESMLTSFIKEVTGFESAISSNVAPSDLKPYFQTEHGKLYQSDAIEFLKTVERESIDLIFADPPYNIKKAEWDTFSSQEEYVDWSMDWIKESHRILKKTGSL